MLALRGTYNNGVIDLVEKPEYQNPCEVLIIFPEKKRGIKKIGGLFKDADIDYKQLENDLKALNRNSEKGLLQTS